MESQQFNRRVRLLQRPEPRDTWGQKIPDPPWPLLRPAWANIRTLNGVGAIKADAPTAVVKASIRLRFCEDVTAGMRVQHRTVLYDIEAVLPDTEKQEHVDLVCRVVR